MMKFCKFCGKEFDTKGDHWYRNPNNRVKLGYCLQCRKHINELHNQWFKNHKKYHREYENRRYHQNKAKRSRVSE